jgi:hypothetical protein
VNIGEIAEAAITSYPEGIKGFSYGLSAACFSLSATVAAAVYVRIVEVTNKAGTY